MTTLHFCFRRINPALSIDLCSIGTIQNDQFVPLHSDHFDALDAALESAGVPCFIHRGPISADAYVFHEDVIDIITAIHPDRVDWFQDTLIIVLTLDIDSHEPSKEEK